MSTFELIFLNTDWQVNSGDMLPKLSDLSHQLPDGKPIEMRRAFDLEPIGEVCLRFILHIDAAPDETTVQMNGWAVGVVQAGQPLVADVTDYVTLEDNGLVLTVHYNGTFGDVWLARVPCTG